MNTKEAIEKLKYWFGYYHDIVEGIHGEGTVEAMKQVEEALKNGKKYKQIIEEVKQYIIDRRTVEEDFATNGKDIIDLIDWLKRKYFPKPKKIEIDWKDKFYELEEEFKEREKELIHQVEYWLFKYHNKGEVK